MICTFCGNEFNALRKSELYCSNSCKQKAYRIKIQERSNETQSDRQEENHKELQKLAVKEILASWESKGLRPWQIRRNILDLHRMETEEFLNKFSPDEQFHYVSRLLIYMEPHMGKSMV